jgi:hypothetical protein
MAVYAGKVPEVVWVVGVMLLLGAVGAVELVPWVQLVNSGNALMLNSAAIGVPLELVYFATLFVALTRGGQRPQGWYWRPFQHHHLLTRRQKLVVLPFYATGALTFLSSVLGIAVTVLGMIGAVVQSH